MPAGMGIRLDDGPGFPGARITPHYDSLLVKITAKARTRKEAAAKLVRALVEFRVRGVKTNKSFLLNVLKNKEFLDGVVDTGFIAANPELLEPLREQDRAQKLLKYIGEVIVNGTPKSLGAIGPPPSPTDPYVPIIEPKPGQLDKRSLKKIYDEDGPEAFAKAVRDNKGLLITDTTWRDAHQSLLATRMRTIDMLNVAEATKVALSNAYSLENWGGATFGESKLFIRISLGRFSLDRSFLENNTNAYCLFSLSVSHRRDAPIFARVSLGPSRGHARSRAGHSVPDAFARCQRCRVHLVSRQPCVRFLQDG